MRVSSGARDPDEIGSALVINIDADKDLVDEETENFRGNLVALETARTVVCDAYRPVKFCSKSSIHGLRGEDTFRILKHVNAVTQ